MARIKFTVKPEEVYPKIDNDLEEDRLTFSLLELLDLNSNQTTTQNTGTTEEKWREFSLNIDLSQVKRLANFSERVIEKLDVISKIVVIILKVIAIFSSDLKSLSRVLKVIVKVVVQKILDLIASLESTGIYTTAIIPDFDTRRPGTLIPILGGFNELKTRITNSCLSETDPKAPKFGPDDQTGGLIFAGGVSLNDPNLLYDLLYNFRILSRFFGFDNPMPSPPKSFKVVPGFYRHPEGDKRLAVKLTWRYPDSYVSGFIIKRCKYRKGVQEEVEDEAGNSHTIRVYKDADFNGGEPYEIEALFGKPSYSYIDWEITPDTLYYYQISSTAGLDFFENFSLFKRVASPLATPPIGVVPKKCIPVSELKRYTTQDIDGNLVDPKDLESSWVVVNVREILGDEIDILLKKLEDLSEKLVGLVGTSSDAIRAYLDFYQKRIQKYLNIIRTIQNLIARLISFNLRGSILYLELPPEKGGTQGFVDRMNSATIEDTQHDVFKNGDKANSKVERNTSALSSGIYFGVVVLYGFPTFGDKEAIDYIVPPSAQHQYKKKVEDTKKSIYFFKSILGLG